jgi:hypothetical protein
MLRAIVARLHVGPGGLEVNPLLLLPLTGVYWRARRPMTISLCAATASWKLIERPF